MKTIGKILFSLLLLLLAVFVVLYLLLQTRWGASWISRSVTEHSDYQLVFSRLEHNFFGPSHLILNDLSFGHKTQPAILVAKRVDLGLSAAQVTQPLHFSTLRLEKGFLNLNHSAGMLPFSANRLQLSEMTINSSYGNQPVQASPVNGGIIPWKPATDSAIGNDASFQLSAGRVRIKGLTASDVLIQGRISSQQLILRNVGADMALGSFTASAQRDRQGNWRVGTLRLNNIRLQNTLSFSEFLHPLLTLPSIHFDRLDVTDARLEGREWALTDFDLALKNVTLRKGNWESNDGSLSMNASTFVNGSLQLDDPIVNIAFSPRGIGLTQFSSRWAGGIIRTSGNWTRRDKKLMLDELAIAGLEYTLPNNWRERWMTSLPTWLDSVEVTKLSVSHNLLIDIKPAFPFQITSLDGNGSGLLLVRDRQWGIWSGNLSLNAAEATFNRVDLRHPSLTLDADINNINVTEMSAFPRSGIIEGLASVSQQPQRAVELKLQGRDVPVNLLQDWGWPALPLEGKGELQLKMQGSLAKDTALKSTTNGTLFVTEGDKKIQQRIAAGQIVTQ